MAAPPSVDVLIAGIRVRLLGHIPKRLLWPARKFKARGTPALNVLCVKDLEQIKQSKSIFKCEEFWLDISTRTLFYPVSTPRVYAEKRRGTSHNLLQRSIVFAMAMLQELNGPDAARSQPVVLYLHASSVATRKGALLFCGESTFGKTTISGQLLADFPKIEDDQALLFHWPGTTRPPAIALLSDRPGKLMKKCRFPISDGTVPIAGVFWLKKGSEFRLEPVSAADAVSLVIYPVACYRRPKAIRHRLSLLIELFKSLPMKELEFRKESEPLIELLKSKAYI